MRAADAGRPFSEDALRAGADLRLQSLDNELQRLHRDVHMMCAHTVFDLDLVAEGVGKAIVAAHEQTAAGAG